MRSILISNCVKRTLFVVQDTDVILQLIRGITSRESDVHSYKLNFIYKQKQDDSLKNIGFLAGINRKGTMFWLLAVRDFSKDEIQG